ncbi:MAG: peptide deformylase [Anaerolineaceae bacterium]|nr:MAG: peptide deformylase [Anaerolineaceae bacterium]
MALLEIVTLPDPVLRRKARPVTDFGPSLQTLADDMIETMRQAPGVGLAAPQVGESIRLIVVEYPLDDEKEDAPKKLFVIANPEIREISAETEMGVEGCLSLPGLQGEVDRALEVRVTGRTRRGQPIKIKAKGWLARIFQHEIDHLDGVVFTDRATKVWKPAPDEPVLDNV